MAVLTHCSRCGQQIPSCGELYTLCTNCKYSDPTAPKPKPTETDYTIKTTVSTKDHDPVNHPQHYTKHASGIECITITEHFNFCIGNAIKYLWRADHKNGLEDLKKAEWYIKREIKRRENTYK